MDIQLSASELVLPGVEVDVGSGEIDVKGASDVLDGDSAELVVGITAEVDGVGSGVVEAIELMLAAVGEVSVELITLDATTEDAETVEEGVADGDEVVGITEAVELGCVLGVVAVEVADAA